MAWEKHNFAHVSDKVRQHHGKRLDSCCIWVFSLHAHQIRSIHDERRSKELVPSKNVHASVLKALESEWRQQWFRRKSGQPPPVDQQLLSGRTNVVLTRLQELKPLTVAEVWRLFQLELIQHVLFNENELLLFEGAQRVPALEDGATCEVVLVAGHLVVVWPAHVSNQRWHRVRVLHVIARVIHIVFVRQPVALEQRVFVLF